jgi:hypothetical protein
MSGIFDRLQKRMEAEAQKDGISPLDLQNLPPLMRKIMRYLLREYEMLYSEICQWASELPEEERPNQADLDQALETLSKQFWLIKRGEGERVRYQANLRRKAGSSLEKSAWNALDAKIAAASKKPPQE